MTEITVKQLKTRLDNKENLILIDVREDFEYSVSNLGCEHIVLGQLENRLRELEEFKNREIVMICRSGGRSSRACSLLERNGFTKVYNLEGGMKAWAAEIEPDMPVA